jgi:hypothetical protein
MHGPTRPYLMLLAIQLAAGVDQETLTSEHTTHCPSEAEDF